MPWISGAIIGGASLLGSSMAGRSAERAADRSAQANLEAARIAAEEARFRPVGLTTRYGTSQFQFGPEGRLTGASYQASPEIRALQDRIAALYGSSLGLAETVPAVSRRLFNLGTGYIDETPEAARQRIFNELQAARQPASLQEEQRLAASVFGRGRAGLNVGATGQPELYTLARAREAQRAADIVAAEEQAQRRVQSGLGVIGAGIQLPVQALAPFQAQFGTEQLLEETARAPLDIGAQLGGRTATAGAKAGESLLLGGLSSARTQYGGELARIAGLQTAGQNFMDKYFSQLFPTSRGVNVSGFGRPGGAPEMSAQDAAGYFGGFGESPYAPNNFYYSGY